MTRGASVIALLVCAAAAKVATAQKDNSRGCELHGRVLDEQGFPIARASVTIVQGSEIEMAFSDSTGAFRAKDTTTMGPATVIVRAIGYLMARRQQVGATRDCQAADFRLESAAARLQPIRVTSERATPPSRLMVSANGAWSSRSLGRGRTSPDQSADIYALAANTPGIAASLDDGGGFSVLGLAADQSVATLDGAHFDADDVPPDAGVLARVSTSPYDASRGGFSGGELSLLTPPSGGAAVHNVAASVGLSPSGAARGAESVSPVQAMKGVVSGNVASAGAFRLSWQGTRQDVAALSIARVEQTAIGDLATRDRVDSLLAAAGRVGLAGPLSQAPQRQSRTASAMLRFDATEWRRTQVYLSLLGNWRNIDGLFAPGLSLRSHGGADAVQSTRLQVGASTDFVNGFLNELTITTSRRVHAAVASSKLPDVDVRLAEDPFSQNADFHLGGNAALPRADASRSMEVRNDLSTFWGHERHLARASIDVTRSEQKDGSDAGSRGAFVFGSVTDFAAAQPELYYWTHVGSQAGVRQDALGLSLGDEWDVSSSFRAVYGVRGDFEATRLLNEAIGDRGVIGSGMSPRVGFSWLPGRSDPQQPAGPRGIIVRGGLGRFRGAIPLSTALRVARSSTAKGEVQLVCAGEQTPRPDWLALVRGAQPPQTCVSGDGEAAAFPAPIAAHFSRGFAPPSAWRASLGMSFPARVRIDLDATYSLGLSQRVQIDQNLETAAGAVLPNEANRPVLAPASAIAATGIISATAGRLDPRVGQVLDFRSTGRTRAAQLSAGLSPQGQHIVGWQIVYTRQAAMDQHPVLGFLRADRTQAGDAVGYVNEWSRAPNEMGHQVVASVFAELPGDARLTVDYTGRTGLRYTPLVAGDVNGDGAADDPAFIFDSRGDADSATGRSIQKLLNSAPRAAARCLRVQLDRIARRNSCVGPWSGDASLELDVPGQRLGLDRATHVALYLGNLLSGSDMLIHGASHAQGWGSAGAPDPVLLRPVGFDAVNGRFDYLVNSGFGRPLPQTSALAAPFSVSLSVQIQIGADPDAQRLRAALSDQPADSVHLSKRLQIAFGHTGISAPGLLLDQTAVRLDDSTMAALRSLQAAVERASQSLWATIASRAAALDGLHGDPVAELLPLVRAARDTEFDVLERTALKARSLLTADERGRLPASLSALLGPGAATRERRAVARRSRGG